MTCMDSIGCYLELLFRFSTYWSEPGDNIAGEPPKTLDEIECPALGLIIVHTKLLENPESKSRSCRVCRSRRKELRAEELMRSLDGLGRTSTEAEASVVDTVCMSNLHVDAAGRPRASLPIITVAYVNTNVFPLDKPAVRFLDPDAEIIIPLKSPVERIPFVVFDEAPSA